MSSPTQEYRRTDFRPPPNPLRGMDAVANSVIGQVQRRKKILDNLNRDALAVDAMTGEWTGLSDHDLQTKLRAFREQFRRGGKAVESILLQALAAIREASTRKLGLRPFPVQIMGALALHRGYMAEMATGEGKTLTASLAAILAGWTGRPCHVVTVNDYLVQRDSEWLAPLYHFCGVRVGSVTAPMPANERVRAYGCDVTYATSKELLADFLRDRLVIGKLSNPTQRLIRQMLAPRVVEGVVMRGLHTAIVDEADSVLIDEAVTPLIIAAPHKNEALTTAAKLANEIVADLETGTDYRANARYKEIELTQGGLEKMVGRAANLPGLWQGQERRLELVIQALVAREFYHRGRQYIVADNKVLIVDEFTGRPMPQRTWREGMHQAIEAKEGLAISDPTETVARLSFQRFFRCFYKLGGMTGTAREAAGEFWQVYGLPVITIPPNRPCIREQWPDRFFLDEAGKWRAVVDEIARIHATNRPLLVGTRSVAASEALALALAERQLKANVLNATRVVDESNVIALAGEAGRITIATNMAGRGTDIKLGPGVAKLGGLHVIATERHESGRVDRQLFGRSGRQGDPGSAQAFISVEDELVRRYLPVPVHKMLVGTVRRNLPAQKAISRAALKAAQSRAQKLAFKQRRDTFAADLWLDQSLSFAGGGAVG